MSLKITQLGEIQIYIGNLDYVIDECLLRH